MRPAALVVEGEAGIGKSTVWAAAVDDARERGFRVLAARPTTAESALPYVTLADLLGGVDDGLVETLPDPQRRAVDIVLLRSPEPDATTHHRAVAAAFLGVVQRLAESSPVLIAVDDLQWVDTSSARALAYAVRRLTVATGILATLRGPGGDS